MPPYSSIAAVDAAIARFVREEDPPGDPHPGLGPGGVEDLARALAALDPDVRVVPVVLPEYELSKAALAAKATRIVAGAGVLYAQLDIFIAGAAPLAYLAWQWKRTAAEKEPSRGSDPPFIRSLPRALALEEGARRALEARGLAIVPFEEAERVVRVSDDPFYGGEYYEIKVFEMLFGMGYPERQR